MNRRLDWVSRHDERSRDYSIRNRLSSKRVPRRKVMWEEGIVLDQGSEGACVGFGWMGELLAQPVAPDQQPEVNFANRLAIKFYKEAKKVDQWAGEDYEGTSVLAGAQVMKNLGFITEYNWCFGIDDVRDALIAKGPVVIGIPWYNGMYDTLPGGLVSVSGELTGGHCILLTGYDPAMSFNGKTYEVFRWRNSWGSDYGVDGSGFITYNDLKMLLAENAEACVPIGRVKPMFDIKFNNENSCKRFFKFLARIFGH